MKKVFSIVSILLLTISLNAQEVCGFDNLLDKVLSDSITSAEFDSVRTAIRNQIVMNNGEAKDITQPNTYTIPVVFHVIGNGTAATLTDAQIITQLQVLNDGFSNSLGSAFGIADDAQITFCLAQKMPDGTPFNGITRTSPLDLAAITVSNNHQMDATGPNSQQALTSVIYFNPSRYLNIWIVNSISEAPSPYVNDVLGYSPFPLMSGAPNQFLDGVVMRSDVVGFTSHPRYNQGRVLIHEVGHYLGLFHTFQFGCSEVINGNSCSIDGDECCDTPPTAVANQNDCILLGTPISCSGGSVMKENHMDYAYDNVNTCRNTFTEEQSDRMHATIQVFRSTLVSFQNLLVTGLQCLPSGLNPTFTTNQPNGSTQFCISNPYGFISAPGATVYSWSFLGATPSTSSVQNPTGISWAVPGTYNVSLTVTDISGASLSSTLQVFVSNCTPITGANANWYFGIQSALSFASGIPTPTNPSSIVTLESSASISNNLGNLIFYTDGQTIWDNLHNAIPGLMNGSPNESYVSSAKGVVIVPRPGTTNFYIFPTSDSPLSATLNIGYGVSLYEYNTSSNSLVSATPIHPTFNYATTEPIVAVPHCNGQDYWVVVKPINNNQPGLQNAGDDPAFNPLPTPVNNLIASYLVTTTGITGTPVLSNSGPFIPSASGIGSTWAGHTMVSPDKKMMTFTDFASGNCYVYFFNSGNGKLEYLTTIPDGLYGVSFSPNSKVLYVNTLNVSTSPSVSTIKQYDISTLSTCNPNPPFVEFNYIPNGHTGPTPIGIYSMQLGPDNKIYVARSGNGANSQRTVATINFPDVLNLSSTSNDCGYNFNAVPLLPGQLCRLDLPNDIIGFIGANPTDFSFCVTGCAQTCFTNLGCGINFTWDFGDGNTITGINGDIPAGTNGGTTSGNFEYPCHTYAGPGSYTVTYSIDGGTPVSHVVNITLPPVPTITGPNPVCSTSTLPESYFAPTGYNYSWTATNASPTTGNLQTFDVSWTSFPATLTLVITDPATGCTNSNSITITQTSTLPIVNAGTDVNVCPPGSVLLNGAVSNGTIIGWSPSTDLSCVTCLNPSASPSTTTTYTLSAFNGCGTSTDQVTVDATCSTLCSTCTPLATSGTLSSTTVSPNQTYCINNDVLITGNVNLISSEFKMATNVTITVDNTAILTIRGSHLYSCSDMWKGIVVKPGGRIIVQPFLSRSTLIEDAFIAIDVQSNSTILNNPLVVKDATFNRNEIGIQITDYSKTSGPVTYPMSVENTVFTSRDISFTPNSLVWPHTNVIKGASGGTVLQSPYINNAVYSPTNANAYLKPPFSSGIKPQAGIKLIGVGSTQTPLTPIYREMKIGATGMPKFNVFDNLRIGIDAISSNFICVNNVFQNNPVGPKQAVAINAVAANLTVNRLQVMPAVANNFTNRFYDVGRAINAIDYYEMIATRCEVRSSHITTAPIASPSVFNGKYGFIAESNRFKTVNFSNNTMYNIENGITFFGSFGPLPSGTPPIFGQYSGQVDINNNVIRPNLPTQTVTTQYVASAISVSNVVSGFNLIFIPNSTININNNTLTSVYRGIGVSSWGKKDIKTNDNIISLVADAFTAAPASPNPVQYGIGWQSNNANTSFGNSIARNTVTGFGTTANTNVRAIITAFCVSQQVNCNTVSETYKGIEFTGGHNLISFTNNSMTNHRYGFVLDNAGFIGVQGNSTTPTDNQWFGTWTAPNFKTATLGGSTAIGSELWVRNTSGVFNPNGSGTTSLIPLVDDYFNDGSANSTLKYVTSNPIVVACNTISPCCPSTGKIARMEQVVQDQELLVNNIAQTRYINKNKVYRMLRAEPNLLDSSIVLLDFYNERLISNSETMAAVEDDFMQRDIVAGQAKAASITVENSIEQNYKTFFESYVKQQTATITTADSLNLATIAMGCPFTDGEVVYQARALFNAVYMSNVLFEDNCVSENARLGSFTKNSSNTLSTDLQVNIYPNPTTGETTLLMLGEENEWLIAVSDIQGRKIYEKTYSTNKINLKLVADNGVYFVHITNNSTNETITKKLIINK